MLICRGATITTRPVVFYLGRMSCSYSVIEGVVVTTMYRISVYPHLRLPFLTFFIPDHTGYAGGVILTLITVPKVTLTTNLPEVFQPIIGPIPIYVIDLVLWKVAVNPEPDHPMNSVISVSKTQPNISVTV